MFYILVISSLFVRLIVFTVLVVHNNRVRLRRCGNAIMNMQEINAVRQIRDIKFHYPAFGARLPQHIALTVVQANVVSHFRFAFDIRHFI
jgi:hypothetical protein